MSTGADSKVKVWDLRIGNCLKTLKGHSEGITCLVKINEYQVVTGSYDKSIKLWDLKTGNFLKTLDGHLKTKVRAT